jgi:hypothetical protein
MSTMKLRRLWMRSKMSMEDWKELGVGWRMRFLPLSVHLLSTRAKLLIPARAKLLILPPLTRWMSILRVFLSLLLPVRPEMPTPARELIPLQTLGQTSMVVTHFMFSILLGFRPHQSWRGLVVLPFHRFHRPFLL